MFSGEFVTFDGTRAHQIWLKMRAGRKIPVADTLPFMPMTRALHGISSVRFLPHRTCFEWFNHSLVFIVSPVENHTRGIPTLLFASSTAPSSQEMSECPENNSNKIENGGGR